MASAIASRFHQSTSLAPHGDVNYSTLSLFVSKRPAFASFCRASSNRSDSFSASASVSSSAETSSLIRDRQNGAPARRSHSSTAAERRMGEEFEGAVQELTVYEFNERDRDSPVLLPFCKPGFDTERMKFVGGLGLFVPFTNKLYSGSLRKRLGITAGYCFVIRYNQKGGGSDFEAAYSFYFGDLGHISVQGPYKDYADTVLTVTGGTGVFLGAYGTATLTNVEFPTCLFYRFQLYGIPRLPEDLRWETVAPTIGVKPFPGASDPGIALPNFTD